MDIKPELAPVLRTWKESGRLCSEPGELATRCCSSFTKSVEIEGVDLASDAVDTCDVLMPAKRRSGEEAVGIEEKCSGMVEGVKGGRFSGEKSLSSEWSDKAFKSYVKSLFACLIVDVKGGDIEDEAENGS